MKYYTLTLPEGVTVPEGSFTAEITYATRDGNHSFFATLTPAEPPCPESAEDKEGQKRAIVAYVPLKDGEMLRDGDGTFNEGTGAFEPVGLVDSVLKKFITGVCYQVFRPVHLPPPASGDTANPFDAEGVPLETAVLRRQWKDMKAALAGEGGGWIPLSERKPTGADSYGGVVVVLYNNDDSMGVSLCEWRDLPSGAQLWKPLTPPDELWWSEPPPAPGPAVMPTDLSAPSVEFMEGLIRREEEQPPAPAVPGVPVGWIEGCAACDTYPCICGKEEPVIIPAPAPSGKSYSSVAEMVEECGPEVKAEFERLQADPQPATGEREAVPAFEVWANSRVFSSPDALQCGYDGWQAGAAWKAASGDSLQRVVEERDSLLARFDRITEALTRWEWTHVTTERELIDSIEDLRREHTQLLAVVKDAYRFHHLGHENTTISELNDGLMCAICEVEGDEGYQSWIKEIKES